MMYRVLIVDDEPVVREGLAHLINWQALGFEIVGDAENGLDGIEKINQLHPNIVVTDIRMPIMDGIEMIRKIQETNSEMEVLILSGYSDFSYAKEAIHLGVSSYLLKPVDEEELENELKKIASRMDLKREQRKAIALYQDYSVSKKLKEFVLHQQHKEELELLFSFDSYQLIACNFEISPLNRAEVRDRVDKIIQKEVFYFNHNSCLYSLLVNRTTREAEKIVLEISETFKGEQVLVLVSKEGNQFLDIQQLYKEIRQLEKKHYLYEELNVLSHSSIEMYIENNENRAKNFQKKLWQEHLLDAIKGNEKQVIQQSLESIGHYYQQNDWSEREIKADLAAIFNFFCEEIEESLEIPLKEQSKRYILSIILSEQSLSQTFAFLFEIFRDFARFFDKMFDKRDIVAEMKEYTKKNYHQNLTLQELGKHLNYSHSYLGKKFRAEEKMSYRTYLDHVRIEEAKKLLKGDQYLVYEIAEKVGYSDSDYFYKKFKKITGTSPKSYQKTTTK